MGIIIGLVLAVLCAAVVAWPFVRGSSGRQVWDPDELSESARQRQMVYQEIQTLRLEYDLGQVSDEEYQERLRVLRLHAASILRDEDRMAESRGALEMSLEEEIRAARAAATANPNRRIACPNCSVTVESSATECPRCGTPLHQE